MTRFGLPILGLVALALASTPIQSSAQSADHLYQEACDGGDLVACNVFGLMLETGDGVPQDAARALLMYERACEGGELVGCTNMGLLYEVGVGMERDLERALGLYRVACEGGELLACSQLGATRDAEPIDLSIEGYRKYGRIGDAATGEALSDAIVDLPELRIRVISDDGGYIEFPDLPRGRHIVHAQREGYEDLVGQVTVPGSGPDFRLLMEPDIRADPGAPGTIVGRVIAEGNQALEAVEISVLEQGRVQTLSNDDGRFTLRGVEPGLVEVRFVRLGYAPRTAMLIAQPGRTVSLTATMVAQPIELEEIEVAVRSINLERSGFYQRAERGIGRVFTPQDLRTIGAVATSDILRRVPSVDIQYGAGGEVRVISRRVRGGAPDAYQEAGLCALSIWIDGIRTENVDLDMLPPQWLEAMEVYQGVEVPVEYARFGADTACGVILVWTSQRS